MDKQSNEVTVVGIKMPFVSMVTFMVKWAIAAIPAALILMILLLILKVVLDGLF